MSTSTSDSFYSLFNSQNFCKIRFFLFKDGRKVTIDELLLQAQERWMDIIVHSKCVVR